eukprot:UC1_evm1s74
MSVNRLHEDLKLEAYIASQSRTILPKHRRRVLAAAAAAATVPVPAAAAAYRVTSPAARHSPTARLNRTKLRHRASAAAAATAGYAHAVPAPIPAVAAAAEAASGHLMTHDEQEAAAAEAQAQAQAQAQAERNEGTTAEETTEVFTGYVCQSLDFGVIHPGSVVESSTLSAVPMPPGTYPLRESLPEELINEGKLSSLQLEGVLYACQRHQIILHGGVRAGFFIGDGAGVGKGRQVAGIIFENMLRGRPRHLWLSVSHDLLLDARRDLSDLGCHAPVLDAKEALSGAPNTASARASLATSRNRNMPAVLFSTYSKLISSGTRSSRKTRLQEIIEWCVGPGASEEDCQAFDGVIVFDESHKAKNLLMEDTASASTVAAAHPPPDESRAEATSRFLGRRDPDGFREDAKREELKRTQSGKTALAVRDLQRKLPKARIVYCSATGVTHVQGMAFMERLGLWGAGTTFEDFGQFKGAIEGHGLGAAELIAMQMKKSGTYVSRSLGFEDAEFDELHCTLTPAQLALYDATTAWWADLLKVLIPLAGKLLGPNNRAASHFWGAHQRFYRQLLMSMKLPTVIEEARKALGEGKCIVIGLQTTGEASAVYMRGSGGGDNLFSLTEAMARSYLDSMFPVAHKETMEVDETAMEIRETFRERIVAMDLPPSPLDTIIDELGGPDNVAEMTGRANRYERQPDGRFVEVSRTKGCSTSELNITERNAFQQGHKPVAIISDAASTGVSLHADRRVANRRRRVHITLELPWSAEKAVQQMGRSHRSNQVSGPIYKLVSTEMGGERRFAAAVARRIRSMGALTRGDRRAASGQDMAQHDYDSPYGRKANKECIRCLKKAYPFLPAGLPLELVLSQLPAGSELAQRLDRKLCADPKQLVPMLVEGWEAIGWPQKVSTMFNRLLGLKVELQNLVFAVYTATLDAMVAVARREGTYVEGVTDVPAESLTLARHESLSDDVQLTVLSADRGISYEKAVAWLEQDLAAGLRSSFYVGGYSNSHPILSRQNADYPSRFKVIRPNVGVNAGNLDVAELRDKYRRVTPQQIKHHWKDRYHSSVHQCAHGARCKAGTHVCMYGRRIVEHYLLTGSVVPHWRRLEHYLVDAKGSSKKALKINRARLDNGQRFVGVVFPTSTPIEALRALLKPEPRRVPLPERPYRVLKSKSYYDGLCKTYVSKAWQKLQRKGTARQTDLPRLQDDASSYVRKVLESDTAAQARLDARFERSLAAAKDEQAKLDAFEEARSKGLCSIGLAEPVAALNVKMRRLATTAPSGGIASFLSKNSGKKRKISRTRSAPKRCLPAAAAAAAAAAVATSVVDSPSRRYGTSQRSSAAQAKKAMAAMAAAVHSEEEEEEEESSSDDFLIEPTFTLRAAQSVIARAPANVRAAKLEPTRKLVPKAMSIPVPVPVPVLVPAAPAVVSVPTLPVKVYEDKVSSSAGETDYESATDEIEFVTSTASATMRETPGTKTKATGKAGGDGSSSISSSRSRGSSRDPSSGTGGRAPLQTLKVGCGSGGGGSGGGSGGGNVVLADELLSRKRISRKRTSSHTTNSTTAAVIRQGDASVDEVKPSLVKARKRPRPSIFPLYEKFEKAASAFSAVANSVISLVSSDECTTPEKGPAPAVSRFCKGDTAMSPDAIVNVLTP